MSTLRTYNVDTQDTTALALKSNANTIVTINSTSLTVNSSANVIINRLYANSLTAVRNDSSTEGGQINFNRSSDDTAAYAIDVYGSSSTPTLRIIDSVASVSRLILDSNGTISTTGSQASGTKFHLTAGNSTFSTLKLSNGALQTSASNGSIEYDGTVFYGTHVDSARGVIATEQFIVSNTTYTLGNNTSVQKIFGYTGAPASGALTVAGGTLYLFETQFTVSSMSTSNANNMGFSIIGAGTASISSASWQAIGIDTSTLSTPAAMGGVYSSSAGQAGNILVATTGSAASVWVRGMFRVTTGGTIIPSIQQTVAAAAVVGTDSWFKVTPMGANTVGYVGNWG